MNNQLLKFIFCFFFCASSILIAPSALADNDVCASSTHAVKLQVEEWPAAPIGNYQLNSDSKLTDLVGYFFGWGVGLGGLGVFIAFIIAGVQYITSVADPGKLNDAKDRIKSSLIGMVLLLSSWAIFNLINPNLNTLNSSNLSLNQNGSIPFLERECPTGQRSDCCKMTDPACDPATLAVGTSCPLVDNPSCNPKYWACCQDNDTVCLKKGSRPTFKAIGAACTDPYECITGFCNATTMLCDAGTKAVGQACATDGECHGDVVGNIYTSYCKETLTGSICAQKQDIGAICENDKDCKSNKCQCDRSIWQKKCVENPPVCNMIFEQKELGCDIVRFYQNPNFQGDYIDFEANDRVYTTTAGGTIIGAAGAVPNQEINADWVFWGAPGTPPSWSDTTSTIPRSYQAFTYQKDADGNVLLDGSGQPMLLSCGETGCACTINRCLNADASGCVKDTADDSSGKFSEYAYNDNVSSREMIGAKVKDPTKQGWKDWGTDKVGEIKSVGGTLLCETIGWGCP